MAQKAYVESGALAESTYAATIGLARLDAVFRSRRGMENLADSPNSNDVADLQALAEAIPSEMLTVKRRCVLNPTFGPASRAVGGADADLVLDDTLIELKTKIEFTLERETFDQLIGYVLLSRVGGFGASTPSKEPLRRVGVYFARHGTLVSWPLDALAGEDVLVEATRWFREHVSRKELRPIAQRPNTACSRRRSG